MSRSAPRLENGSKIAIIGGGPAGSFFAHFALQFARKAGMELSVSIFDGKDFIQSGPRGCNMCAGVISETLVDRLAEQDILIPERHTQRRIEGYYLHTRSRWIQLIHPWEQKRIITVFRGNGPRFWDQDENVSFDDFLLEHVRSAGAEWMAEPVKNLHLPSDSRGKAQVIYGSEENGRTFEADLVVGAFGLNTSMIEKIRRMDFGYQPPRILRTGQMEIWLGADLIREGLGNYIHIFMPEELDWLSFGSLIPKREHVTISVVGKRDITGQDILTFLRIPSVRRMFPPGWEAQDRTCRCFPKIPLTPAKHPFTDRFVIIGDASFCRYYKNGIESAFVTAHLASEAAFERNLSGSSFRRGYFREAKKRIISDNRYGRTLFKVYDMVSRSELLAEAHFQVLISSRRLRVAWFFRSILWDMFTGNVPYRDIFRRALNPFVQIAFVRSVIKTLYGRGRRSPFRSRAVQK